MLKKINISTVVGLFSLFFGVQAEAAPVISVDAPRNRQPVTGVIQIYGWASDIIKMDQVTLRVDNQPELIIGYGGERSDVGQQRPNDDDAHHAGFSTALNTHLLGNGRQTITLSAKNTQGEITTTRFEIVVFNPPGGRGQDRIDLSRADIRLQGQTIILEQATINNQNHSTVALGFDASTNGFHFTDISAANPSTTSAIQGKIAYTEYGCAQSACHSVDPTSNQNQVLKGNQHHVITKALAGVPQMAMMEDELGNDSQALINIAAYLKELK